MGVSLHRRNVHIGVSPERRNVHIGCFHVDGRGYRRKGRVIDAQKHAWEASQVLSRETKHVTG